MSISSEFHEWVVAAKELYTDERKKHPCLYWFILIIAFVYAFFQVLNLR